MRRATGALALICVAQFMVVLGVTVVTITMPAVQADLHLADRDTQWLITCYTLVFAGLLITAGRAADVYGRRLIFGLGLALFGAASLACAAAPTVLVLLAGRAVQGAGAAALASSALAIVVTVLPAGPRRARGIAWYTAAQAAGGASGWVAGGLVADQIGWRWLFLANVPICVAGLLVLKVLLPESRDAGTTGLDVPGAVLITAGMSLFILGCTRLDGGGAGWWFAAAGLAVLICFALVERRSRSPLMPPALLRRRPLLAGLLVAGTITATTTSVLLLCSMFLQEIAGMSATASGLAFLPFNLAVVFSSLAGPALIRRFPVRRVLAAGLLLIAAGALVTLLLTADGRPLPVMLPAFLLLGTGNGLAAPAAFSVATRTAHDQPGVISGMVNTASELGVAVGVSALVTAAAIRTAAVAGDDRPGSAAMLAGYHLAYLGAAAIAVTATIAATAMLRRDSATGAAEPSVGLPVDRDVSGGIGRDSDRDPVEDEIGRTRPGNRR